MNSFNNDGSFFERFKSLQQKEPSASIPAPVPPPPILPKSQNFVKEIKTEPSDSFSNNECSTNECKSKAKSIASDGGFLSRFKQLKKSGLATGDASASSASTTSALLSIKRQSDYSLTDAAIAMPKERFGDGSDEMGTLELDPKTRDAIRNLAREVLDKGASAEDDARTKYRKDAAFWFLYDRDSAAYKYYQRLVQPSIKREPTTVAAEESTFSNSADSNSELPKERKRKSRWDTDESGNKKVTILSSTKPKIEIDAASSFHDGYDGFEFDHKIGSSVEESRKQMLEQAQLRIIQQRIEAKRAAMKAREQAVLMGKAKPVFEYDSDEEADDGTWEHKLRKMEMEKTKDDAQKLTTHASGKHHISQFLPTEELEKFMSTYQAAKDGKTLDKSDYQESKLTEDNKGFKLLQKMGWTEGNGLGATGQGITAPINKGRAASDNEGLGASASNDVSGQDDEFDLYRKRMMLAYRFRPNPLNNPRRPYY